MPIPHRPVSENRIINTEYWGKPNDRLSLRDLHQKIVLYIQKIREKPTTAYTLETCIGKSYYKPEIWGET